MLKRSLSFLGCFFDSFFLKVNLIRSHAVGVGEPLKPYLARMLCLLRINALAKGFSGISAETLKGLILLFNLNLMSRIPSQGTVGASGDLCPLAHLALGLIGEGQIWNPKTEKYTILFFCEVLLIFFLVVKVRGCCFCSARV